MKSPIFNIHDVFIVVTVTLCLLLALFQLVASSKNCLAKSLLAFFTLDIALGALSVLLFWSDSFQFSPFFKLYLLPYGLIFSLLLKGPLLYFYVRSITVDGFKLARRDWVHLLPVIFCFSLLILLEVDSDDLRYIHGGPYEVLYHFIWTVVKFLPPLYALAATLRIHLHRSNIKLQYSNLHFHSVIWLYILTIGFGLNWLWSAAVHVSSFYLPYDIRDISGIADNYLTFFLVLTLFVISLLYTDKIQKHKFEALKPEKLKEIPESSILKITQAMDIDRLYLDPRLTLEGFSEKIDLPYRSVSAIINTEFKSNFFEYVNNYRIEEAKRLLADHANAELTILDVLLMSGFNSRSAFHRFWSRLVDISPTEFRKK